MQRSSQAAAETESEGAARKAGGLEGHEMPTLIPERASQYPISSNNLDKAES